MVLTYDVDRCQCGLPAAPHVKCGDHGKAGGLVPCCLLTCRADGGFCAQHRHSSGTMGYPANARVTKENSYFLIYGSFWTAFSAMFWNSLPVRWRLRRLWRVFADSYPPPAPLPEFLVLGEGDLWYLHPGDETKGWLTTKGPP